MSSNNILADLQPQAVFKYFEQICAIPHGSGNVKKISDYLCEFAKERNLWFKQDESYNVIIKKPASDSESKAAPVILQGHIDMVALKTDDKVKDMEKEGLDLYIEDGYVKADRTTLGADDGIAVAYALAILDSKDMSHPPIEAVFTVDEEVGMTGAEAINLDCLDGKIMLNIDSEEEGIFLSGCAGGATLKASYPLNKSDITGTKITIKINGLTSGHSGTDIICQRANANILMGRLLFAVKECVNIVGISGGEKDNSIAPFANAAIMTQEADKVTELLNNTANVLKEEYSVTDSQLIITIKNEAESRCQACDDKTSQMIINVLNYIPDGVIKMSNDIKGLVQTSLNLGVVSSDESAFYTTYLVRSSSQSEKEYLTDKIGAMTDYLGGTYELAGVYPAWEFKKDSAIRDMLCDSYKKLFGKDALVETMHAGVECGIMAAKIDGLDCVSFGPDIIDIHTVKEKLDIESTRRTWELITEVLKQLA